MPIVFALLVCLGVLADPPGPRHNLIVVTLDDVGAEKVGYTNEHPEPANTPTLDLLAATGVRFDAAYVNPVCSPTRVSILTGRHAFRTGVGSAVSSAGSAAGNFTPLASELTLPELLVPAGYRAWAVGKWHMGTGAWPGGIHRTPVEWGGFERHLGAIGNITNSTLAFNDAAWFKWVINDADLAGAAQYPVNAYATSDAVDRSLALVKAHAGERFFLWLAFNAPHKPWHAPPPELHTVPNLCAGNCGARRKYLAALEAVDTELGRLLRGLPPAVLARTTVVVLGDNGSPNDVASPPWPADGYKSHVTERGTRVPFVVWGSAVVNPGRRHAGLVSGVDLFPTLLELAGVPLPADGVPRDGRSFADVLADRPSPARDWIYTEHFQPNGIDLPRTLDLRAVRRRDGWKLHHSPLEPPHQQWRLHHLPSDPFEQLNRYPPQTPAERAAFEELRALLERLRG